MSRTTPDPVFTAAAQEELERRVRTSRRASSTNVRPRRAWVVELSAIAGITALAAGAVIAVSTLRPAPDSGGAPVGAVTRTLEPAPTAPPASTPPPTEPARATALVGPGGAVQRSDAQIRAYAQARGFSDVWAQQGILDRDCMAQQGFLYDPELGLITGGGMSASDSAAFRTALLGPTTSEPYDWRTAGCHGASVHETGQDGND